MPGHRACDVRLFAHIEFTLELRDQQLVLLGDVKPHVLVQHNRLAVQESSGPCSHATLVRSFQTTECRREALEHGMLEVVVVECIKLRDVLVPRVERGEENLLLGVLVSEDHLVEPSKLGCKQGDLLYITPVEGLRSVFVLGNVAQDGVVHVQVHLDRAGHESSLP